MLLSSLVALVLQASVSASDRSVVGPMVAYAEMTEACVWVQTSAPSRVSIGYRPVERQTAEGRNLRWEPLAAQAERRSPEVQATSTGDYIAKVVLTGLPMGTRFTYRVLVNDKEVRRPYPLSFQTLPHWRWRTNPPDFSFAIGSCSYTNEEAFDRPGKPYGEGHQVFESIRAQRPDFMLWMGDNVYYREPDWLSEAAMRRRWRHSRTYEPLQALLGSVHHYAIWDDHDFGPNDADRAFRLKGPALEVFDDYFPAPVRGTPEARGVFFRFEWGDVEFFMLDDRYYRSPNNAPAAAKTMLGAAQLQWLKDSLTSSGATFKIIVGGGQMLNPLVYFEGFGKFEAEQRELFDFIAAQRVKGVLFLSGDRHATELLKLRWPGAAYDWYEFTSSPLTAGPGRYAPESDNAARVTGTWVNERNFGMIRVAGAGKQRKLTLTSHSVEGVELWRHEVTVADLEPLARS